MCAIGVYCELLWHRKSIARRKYSKPHITLATIYIYSIRLCVVRNIYWIVCVFLSELFRKAINLTLLWCTKHIANAPSLGIYIRNIGRSNSVCNRDVCILLLNSVVWFIRTKIRVFRPANACAPVICAYFPLLKRRIVLYSICVDTIQFGCNADLHILIKWCVAHKMRWTNLIGFQSSEF